MKDLWSWLSRQAKVPVATPVVIPSKPVETKPDESKIEVTLSWEKNYPERKSWTNFLVNLIGKELFVAFDSAKDATRIHPKYNELSKEERVLVWAEFISAVTYFECGWNTKSFSVDVGTTDKSDTWSVGLLQLSVVDQESYGIKLGYNFEDLQDPIKNLNLGVRIMARQILKTGKAIISKGEKGLYWAVIHPGGKYDQSEKIFAMVSKIKFSQTEAVKVQETKTTSEPPWLTIARKEIGTREVRGGENKRIIEYHAATSLKAKEDEVSWCSSFINWCLVESGIKGTNSAWARLFLEWGSPLVKPRVGCICVIERNGPGGDSHVFFYLGERDGKIIALGGNQSDSVCIAEYDKSLVLGYRWPEEENQFEHDVPVAFI